MKKISILLGLLPALALTLSFTPLHAQYNPPPPPEEQGAGNQPPPGADQGTAPAPDQNAPPMDANGGAPPMDPNAPPPDAGGAPDQGAPPPDAQANDQGAPPDGSDAGGDVNFDTFYNNLSSQGNWVQTDNYGYVWQPGVQDPNWAPYTDGHWVYTDEGWTWVAGQDEPWGWATYHYGRWVNLDGTGWVWVPGYTWAPAWVSWRYGGGYCGWAPLPPTTFVGIDFGGNGFGFQITGDCDTVFGIGPGYYNFVPVAFIGARDYRGHYANRNNNFTIINNTRNVTNIVVNSQQRAGRFGRVNVGGPSFSMINAQAQTPVQRVTLARAGAVGNARLSGNQLAVFAPRIAATPASVRPASVAGRISAVRVNRGTSINSPLAVNARVRPAGPSAAQVQAAQTAQSHAGNAGVATASTRFEHGTTPALTTLEPHQAGATAGTSTNRPAATTTHIGTTSNVRPESAFTGENNAQVHHATTAGATPGASTEVHHFNQSPASTGNVPHTTEEHAATPTVQHETQSQEYHPQAQSTFHPEAQPTVHPQTETHAVTPEAQHEVHPQSQEFHPQSLQPHPSAPQPQAQAHPQAQPAHPAAQGGQHPPAGKDEKQGQDQGH
jgi:hypothetical protein